MNYDVLHLGAMAGVSAVTIFALNHFIADSAKIAMRARYALRCISLRMDSRNYHDEIQDAKIDGLAGLLIGGRRALYKAVREGRK